MIFLLLHARNGNGTNEAAAFEVNREAAAYTCELCRFQTGIGKRIAAGCHLQADQIRTLPEHVGCADLSAKSAEVDGADRLHRVIEQLLVAKLLRLRGNHTWHHYNMSQIADLQSFTRELQSVADQYREATGEEMLQYYRPPQGVYSEENLKMAKSLGYRTVFWSLAYVDWNRDAQPTPECVYLRLCKTHHKTAKSIGGYFDAEYVRHWENRKSACIRRKVTF